jgi:cystathionine beta-synthase
MSSCPHSAAYRADRAEGDGPSKCTWYPNTTEKSPHEHYRPARCEKILPDILHAIGYTPVVRINRLGKEAGLSCELVAKCEFFNAGGSVKDRIGKRMVEDAAKSGRIQLGDTLIEPTSGNTGIGLALSAAVRGYKCIITLPEKMSQEKVNVLKALGAEIIRTPTEAASESPESHISVAKKLQAELPNSHILDQYGNPSNPLAHYDGTAEEILEQCDGKLDMVVIGAGTGGTITGIARKLKERLPDLIVVGVDPKGSILAEPDSLNDDGRDEGYQVEGVGYDFVPTVLDRSIVDRWVKVGDEEALITARRMIREEGLLCGGSSGSAMAAALRAAQDLGADKRCLVLLPDSIRNYLTKFVSDDWMWSHGIVDTERKIGTLDSGRYTGEWLAKPVGSLPLATPFTVQPDVSVKAAIDILAGEGFDQLPVVDVEGNVLGVVTEGNLVAKLAAGRVKATDAVSGAMFKQFHKVDPSAPLSELVRIFDNDHFALVCTSQKNFGAAGVAERTVISGVLSRIDLLKFIAGQAE